MHKYSQFGYDFTLVFVTWKKYNKFFTATNVTFIIYYYGILWISLWEISMNYLTIITILTESVNDNYLRLNRNILSNDHYWVGN